MPGTVNSTSAVVLAFDSFKGSLSAPAACSAAARGAETGGGRPIECPLSDGGEGFVECLARATGAQIIRRRVSGPLFKPVWANLALLDAGSTAVLEAAQVCGLGLVPADRRSPLDTTSLGLGELLAQLPGAVRKAIVGLGGTATNDGGVGLCVGLGGKFFDRAGRELLPVGRVLEAIARYEQPRVPSGLEVVAASDVANALYGPDGAAFVYAPQKGASPDEVEMLDRGLRRLAEVVSPGGAMKPGAGAAGGLGFALTECLGATMESGAELAIELTGLRSKLSEARLCITGEGRTDAQTASGKLPAAVARACAAAGVPCVCVSGSLGEGWEAMLSLGCAEVVALSPEGEDLDVAFREAASRVESAVERAVRVYMFRG